MNKAAASAVRGGTAGACAMGANVACLMWMRTTVSARKPVFEFMWIVIKGTGSHHQCCVFLVPHSLVTADQLPVP